MYFTFVLGQSVTDKYANNFYLAEQLIFWETTAKDDIWIFFIFLL